MKKNITLSINSELLQQVKIIAAKRGQSVSQIIRDFMVDLTKTESSFAKAKKQATLHLNEGLEFDSGPYYKTRDELHER